MNMARSMLLLGMTIGLAACGDEKAANPTDKSATTKDGLPMEFSPFTIETLKSLDGKVTIGEDYKSARKKLDAHLGMSIYHDTGKQMWAVAEGDECWSIGVTPDSGVVKEVFPATGLSAADGVGYEHCVAASNRNRCFRDDGDPGECTRQFPGPE
jgi:hypothetical protein